MTQTAVSGWQPPPYINAIHRRKAMSVTADMLSAVIGYRDFQIPAKNDSYFSHREMLWEDTPVCSYINAIRGLGNPQELKGIEMRSFLISIPFNSL